ncbi:MAG: hypothetical protein E4H13_13740 [Calditrichales bacterium]|nr:MAG: hypothetical protein E4H13_13740 [Calditrichales bacterium]
MSKDKRWINNNLERKAFEEIIRTTFQRYKDNMMCSQDTVNQIVLDVTRDIRSQLQGISREYLTK